MKTSTWPALIQECVRLLCPGGILRLTETDTWGVSNKPAFSALMTHLTGHSFDPSGRTFGITPMLEHLLMEVGLESIGSKAHAINFSAGAVAHQAMYQNFRVFFKLVEPFVLKARSSFPEAGLPDQEELDRLYE